MEDYTIDIMIDQGPNARSVQIAVEPFTLIGATTRSGLLTAPLRSRFGINMRLQYYDHETLRDIIIRSAGILNTPIEKEAALEISRRSREHHVLPIYCCGEYETLPMSKAMVMCD